MHNILCFHLCQPLCSRKVLEFAVHKPPQNGPTGSLEGNPYNNECQTPDENAMRNVVQNTTPARPFSPAGRKTDGDEYYKVWEQNPEYSLLGLFLLQRNLSKSNMQLMRV